MSGKAVRNRSKFGVVLVLAVAALAVVSSAATSASGCKKVGGEFTLTTVTGPTCVSPVGLCAAGSYKGGIKGTSFFTGSSLTPTVDTPTTAVVLLTGDNLIHTLDGDLMTKDAIVFRTIGAGEFAEVDTIIGGTGQLVGVTGTITATGTFTAAGGEGRYDGDICAP